MTVGLSGRGPLDGVVVADVTHVLAGPFATMMLAELGARVIKIERPGRGDDTRAFAPFLDGRSAYFATVNRGKESLALDLKDAGDRAIFDKLLDRADVLVENHRPGAMARLGYGWDAVHSRWPRLIQASVSGFGQTGPDSEKPSYDMIVQALGGVMSITGEAKGEPVRVGASVGDIVAGMFLTQGVLAALHDRHQTGLGRYVDVAMFDSQLAILEHAIAIYEATGRPPGRTGARHPSVSPFETYHAADDLFVIAAGNDKLFRALTDAIERPDLAKDPHFANNGARCKYADLLKRQLELTLLRHPVAHWLEVLEAAGVPAAPIYDISQAMAHPQAAARNMVVETRVGAGPEAPPLRVAGNPIKISGAPDPATRGPAPDLDGDRAAVLAWLAEGDTDVEAPAA